MQPSVYPAPRRRLFLTLALGTACLLGPPSMDASAAVPATFWGVDPVALPTQAQVNRIAAGGVDTIRVPMFWWSLQARRGATPQWGQFDPLLKRATRRRIEVLPIVFGSPRWIARKQKALPIRPRQIRAWKSFLRAAVRRYGPGGGFWRKHRPGSPDPLPYRPIRIWQLWNEANFFYFADPVSPAAYAKLLIASKRAIKKVDPGARLIIGGLFALPRERPPRAYSATAFLDRLCRRGRRVKRSFDGVALHPYSDDASSLKPFIRSLRGVMRRHGDGRTGLWITEMGWGSAPSGPFQVGRRGQARELTRAFTTLRKGRRAWRLKRVYWFSLTDDPSPDACNFCGSSGLFTAAFEPKPAWGRFAAFAGGRP
jgi:hypothetical protein